MPSLEGNLLPSGTKLPHKKLDTLGYHTVKTRSLYLPGLDSVPGRDTPDGQTDRIAIPNTCSQQYLPVQLSRVKTMGHILETFLKQFPKIFLGQTI